MSYNDIAIRVSNLNKCFRVYDTPLDRLKQLTLPTLLKIAGIQSEKRYFHEFWAVKNTSFEIKKGEVVGIVGRNGSGKSSLLQLICGILTPTSGSVEVNGRIAALLELGSGFNPDFTGRENIYFNASILGFSNQEIDSRFNEIASFADIGQYIDQPVKTYSSGMAIRLAFAVAANTAPEILIIDEALSVGDELFQRKCFSRIDAIRANGTTILFVSHSSQAILELCDRVVLMNAGEKLTIATPNEAMGHYHKLLYAPDNLQDAICAKIRHNRCDSDDTQRSPLLSTLPKQADFSQEHFDSNLIPGSTIDYESLGARINSPAISTSNGDQVNNLICGENYYFSYSVLFTSEARNVRFGMLIKTMSGLELGGGVSENAYAGGLAYVEAGTSFNVSFRFRCALNEGMYFLNAGVVGNVDGSETFLHRLIDIAAFRVQRKMATLMTGTVDFECDPKIEIVVKQKTI
jgi:lipopolysaccharide transport system ATP-binding protein